MLTPPPLTLRSFTLPTTRAALTSWLPALVIARLLLHALTNGQYGFHRDELAVLDDARALAWGYVAYPPMTPLLARIGIDTFGDTLGGLRAFAAVAQAVATLMAGLIARELGGRRMAQVVAALAVTAAPFSMLQGGEMQYAGVELAWWTSATWMLLRLVNGSHRRWWLGVGLMIGLGMLTRYTMLIWATGLAVGVLATPMRRQLAAPWPWLGAALSLLVFAPNAWWQWQHDFIYLDFVRHIHARDVRIGRTDGFLPGQLLVGASPLTAPLWIAGLAWLAVAKAARRWRVLVWLYVVPLLLMLLAQARDYYMAPAYPVLLAAGAVALQSGLSRLRPRIAAVARGAVAVVLLCALATTALIMLPVWPVDSQGWRIAHKYHGEFAEQIGWPELVAQVAAVYRALPPDERARTAIFANNYGEAGAINRYGPRYGLPRAISTINSYWAHGYGEPPPTTVIVLGDNGKDNAGTPATCTLAGRVRIPHGVQNEESGHPDIFVCRDFRVPIHALWPPQPTFG